jgi:hypothetical protein
MRILLQTDYLVETTETGIKLATSAPELSGSAVFI